MNYQTIDEVYAANNAIREKFKQAVAAVPAEKAQIRPSADQWSVAQLVEHVAIVNEGMGKICAKLLSKAESDGRTSDGSVRISANFVEKASASVDQKLQAPEMVRPADEPSISEAMDRLDAAARFLSDLRPKFEAIDGTAPGFPHPYFGDLSAQEWLVLAGGHEARHLTQIRRLAAELDHM
jgi:uncharacterized damage-inducible protein DinB